MKKYFIALVCCFFLMSASAQEKNLKLIDVRTYDSTVNFNTSFPTPISFTVPANRIWRVENIMLYPFNGASNGHLLINGKIFWFSGGQAAIYSGSPIWLKANEVLSVRGISSINGGDYNYRLAIFEFALEQ